MADQLYSTFDDTYGFTTDSRVLSSNSLLMNNDLNSFVAQLNSSIVPLAPTASDIFAEPPPFPILPIGDLSVLANSSNSTGRTRRAPFSSNTEALEASPPMPFSIFGDDDGIALPSITKNSIFTFGDEEEKPFTFLLQASGRFPPFSSLCTRPPPITKPRKILNRSKTSLQLLDFVPSGLMYIDDFPSMKDSMASNGGSTPRKVNFSNLPGRTIYSDRRPVAQAGGSLAQPKTASSHGNPSPSVPPSEEHRPPVPSTLRSTSHGDLRTTAPNTQRRRNKDNRSLRGQANKR